MGAGGIWVTPVPSTQICCELKPAQKKKTKTHSLNTQCWQPGYLILSLFAIISCLIICKSQQISVFISSLKGEWLRRSLKFLYSPTWVSNQATKFPSIITLSNLHFNKSINFYDSNFFCFYDQNIYF